MTAGGMGSKERYMKLQEDITKTLYKTKTRTMTMKKYLATKLPATKKAFGVKTYEVSTFAQGPCCQRGEKLEITATVHDCLGYLRRKYCRRLKLMHLWQSLI